MTAVMIFKWLNGRPFWILVTTIAAISGLTVWGMRRDDHGWYRGQLAPCAMVLCMMAYTTFMTISLRRKLPRLDQRGAKQALLLTFSLAFPMVYMAILIVLTATVLNMPRLFGPGGAGLGGGHLLRHTALRPGWSLRGSAEKAPLHSAPSVELESGRSYLFESKGPEGMYNALLNRMVEGLLAPIISRTHPDQLRSRYELTRTPFLWLAETPGPNNVHPGNLQMLTHMTTEFLRKGPSLVAIDGLEYLLVNNDITRVLKFLGQLRDMAVVEGAILLVTVDPMALSERQRAILERGIDIVIGKEGAETAI